MGNSQIKVCHMTSVHKRYDARILKKECCTLVANGYDVTLIVADNKPEENYNGVKIVSSNFTPKNRLDRIINSKKYVLKKAIEINAEIYHFHDPELIPIGLELLKRGKKVIYDSHEDYPKDIRYKKLWMPLVFRWLVAFVFNIYEKHALQKFSAVISVTPQIVERFSISNKNAFLITNYPLLVDVEAKCFENNNNKQYPLIACFAGSIQTPWVFENFIKAIQDTSFRLIMAGTLQKQEYLDKLKELDKANKIEFIGRKTQEEVWKIYKKSILGVAIADYAPTEFNGEGSLGVNKIFEYMMFGLPIICTNFTLWKNIIDRWKCGFVVDPNNYDEIYRIIHSIENNLDALLQMGANAKEAVAKEFNWSTQATTLLKLYQKISNLD